ncbi:L,D-transpeptidase family protein, partial [Candidatus Hydrogenedentota bacterium]
MKLRTIFVGVIVLAGLVVGIVYLNQLLKAKELEQQRQEYDLAESIYFEAVDEDDEDRYAKAKSIFNRLLKERAGDPQILEGAYIRIGLIEETMGEYERAKRNWLEASVSFPSSDSSSMLDYHIGKCCEELGEYEEARKRYEAAVKRGGTSDPVLFSKNGLARMLDSIDGEWEAARGMCAAVIEASSPGDGPYEEAIDMLGRLNVMLLTSRRKMDDKFLYNVKAGDSVTKLGSDNNVARALIKKINSLDERGTLHINQTLLIPTVDFSIVVDLSDRHLVLFNGGKVFKRYSVGIGKKETPTTPGKYEIKNKMIDPDWTRPGITILAGDPRNELGTRWMGLKGVGPALPNDLGIHGTIDPSSIGWASSSGCVRMFPADVEELFDLMTYHVPVEIVS